MDFSFFYFKMPVRWMSYQPHWR